MRLFVGIISLATAASLIGSASASGVTAGQAQRAVVQKAVKQYPHAMRYHPYASCKKLSRSLFDCDYGAEIAPEDAGGCGFSQGLTGGNASDCPIAWEGTATVRSYGGGPLARVKRPHLVYL